MLLNRPVTTIMLVTATFIFGYVALTNLSVKQIVSSRFLHYQDLYLNA